MYLKSIEVNGFKSFANKIIFEFNDGITGIVGPNGSGKSNVADAVRWVLGEQSAKQLRGSKMEDVIFAGTQLRKAQSSAYVAITLDNSDHKLAIDYDEVKVARRVFRSGESEYLINGSACRLRDVQELFFDTGIGKEGYSIIGQGQIEKILSGKPDDRRELFDEAAGIVKFKKRKTTAEKNLLEERDNLSRIKDILHEIEIQLAPLERQSVKAKQFLKLRDELRKLEINMFIHDYEKIYDEDSKTTKSLEIAQAGLDEANGEYESTREEYDRLEAELESLNTKIEALNSQISEKKIGNEKAEGDVNVLLEQIAAINISIGHCDADIERVNASLKENEEELEELNEKLGSRDKILKELDDEKIKLDEKYINAVNNIKAYTEELDKKQKKAVELLNLKGAVNAKLERNSTLLEQNRIKKTELNQKMFKQKVEEEEINALIRKYSDEFNNSRNRIEELNKENEELEKKVASIQEKINADKRVYEVKQQENLRNKSRLESLKNMTERYEGYGNSIRKVMERKKSVSGIIGVVADIIKVDAKYETAVETALGSSIQNIVTENENVAKELINYLKVNKFGRATFLPLTTVRARKEFSFEKAMAEKGAIGTANTLIEAGERFNELLKSLCGSTLVVDNIDNALNIFRKYNSSIRIVTLEGELLSPGGSMSGGAFKNTSNLLSRRREITQLEEKIARTEEEITKIFAEANSLRGDRSEFNMKIDDNKDEIADLTLKNNSASINLAGAKQKATLSKSFYSEISGESSRLSADENNINTVIENLNCELSDNDLKTSENAKEIKELEKKIAQSRTLEKEANDGLIKIGLDYSGLEEKYGFYTQNREKATELNNKLNGELKELSAQRYDYGLSAKEKEKEINEQKALIEQGKKDVEALLSGVTQACQVRDKLKTEHKAFFSKREELSQKIQELDREVFRLTARKEKLSEKLDQLVSYMREEYELGYADALEYRNDEIIKDSSLNKNISGLKASIKALGDVNVNAVEDYKNLVARYDELKGQYDDLVSSEDKLVKIIEELDAEMRKQFTEKFAIIGQQFDIVFRQLFGGGKGTLELTEGEDILEAGIRINAQPPGKKLQNMMQLSGGEKALTAISLLFAIQNLKPSPFCLLDEIEAALDDSNVKRFAQYLHKLTANTQFIVITHRRGTMAAADILYGITMQEKGVSTLVSVNLIMDDLEKEERKGTSQNMPKEEGA